MSGESWIDARDGHCRAVATVIHVERSEIGDLARRHVRSASHLSIELGVHLLQHGTSTHFRARIGSHVDDGGDQQNETSEQLHFFALMLLVLTTSRIGAEPSD